MDAYRPLRELFARTVTQGDRPIETKHGLAYKLPDGKHALLIGLDGDTTPYVGVVGLNSTDGTQGLTCYFAKTDYTDQALVTLAQEVLANNPS